MEDLIGKWQIVSLRVIQKSGRQVVKKYADGEYTWEFFLDGALIERISGHAPGHFKYYYEPGILLIGRKKSLGIYYADFLRDDELILSDIPNSAIIELVRVAEIFPAPCIYRPA